MKNKKLNHISILIIIFVVLLISLFHLFSPSSKVVSMTIPVETDEITIDYSKIYKKKINDLKKEYNNDDVVGYLYVPDTEFNDIIVQTNNNDYYLNNSIYKTVDWRGQGFLDYRLDINNSNKLIIYGHNSSIHKLPYKFFENYYEEEYFKEHRFINLMTDKYNNKYEIFAVYVEPSDWSYYSRLKFNSDEEFYKHIMKLKAKSFYETNTELKKDDEIIIIQTCSYLSNYYQYKHKFLLVMGKLVDKGV